MLETTMDITVMRLAITFPSADAYVAGWQAHPAFAHAWNDDLEAYARYDLIEDGRSARCVASAAAVRADSAEMMLDETTRLALDQVPTDGSVQMLRAERGLFDEQETPLIPADQLHAFAADHPEVHVEQVADVNHYTLVMGDSPGPARVAAAIERARETAR
jgi:hypothetical protein